jgi:iron complex outermembrane recepter protein
MRNITTLGTRSAIAAILAGAALAAPPASLAQSAPVQDASQSNTLEEIVVTAQRRSENLEKTPLSVTALGADLLQKKAITSDEDLQSAVPGLTIRETANSNQLSYAIRGQSVDAFSNSPPAVLQYVNEVQVTPNSAVPFYDLQSIQVLKGPQGTLFGRNATGGAVLFTSAKPTDTFGGYMTVRFGDYSSRIYEGAINIPIIDDKLLVRLAGTSQYHDGYAYNLYTDSRLGVVDREGFRGSVFFRLNDAITNDLVIDYAHSGGSNAPNVAWSAYAPGQTNNGYVLNSSASALYGPGLDATVGVSGAWAAYLAAHPKAFPGGLVAFTAAQNARGPYIVDVDSNLSHSAENTVVSNITNIALGANTTVKNIFGYTGSSVSDVSDYDGTVYQIEGTGEPGVTPNGTQHTDRTYSEELQLLGKTLDSQLDYVVGLYYSDDLTGYTDHVYFFDVSPIVPVTYEPLASQQRFRSAAAYAQGTYDLSKLTGVTGLGVTAGVRYTSETVNQMQLPGNVEYGLPGTSNSLSQTFDKPSWQFGIQEQLNSELLLYVVSRNSWRAGGYNVTAPQTPETAANGGAAFNPETTTDAELGSKYQGHLGSFPVRLNFDVYEQWVKDIQRTTYATVPGFGLSSLTVNIPRAQITGAEFDGQMDLTSWLQVGANLAYTDARFTENAVSVFGNAVLFGPFADTPKWSGTVFAQASLPMPGTIGTLSLRGDVYTQSTTFFSSTDATITPDTQLPVYTIANFRLGLDHVANSNLSLGAALRNAFNRVYYVGGLPVGEIESVNNAAPGSPRTFYLEAKYTF